MDETPNDSGASASDLETASSMAVESETIEPMPSAPSAGGFHLPSGEELGELVRRPAVWGLLLLIAVVLIVQIWLLFL